MDSYKDVWIHYGAIAKNLGFTNEEIIDSLYSEK